MHTEVRIQYGTIRLSFTYTIHSHRDITFLFAKDVFLNQHLINIFFLSFPVPFPFLLLFCLFSSLMSFPMQCPFPYSFPFLYFYIVALENSAHYEICQTDLYHFCLVCLFPQKNKKKVFQEQVLLAKSWSLL